MAEINKLSPEKALKKLRESDVPRNAQLDEKTAELDEEIRRMREQRLRLELRQHAQSAQIPLHRRQETAGATEKAA